MLGRPWHIDAVRKSGLTITGIWGDYRIKACDLYTSVDEVKKSATRFDLIVLTVKSYDTAAAVDSIATLMSEQTMVLSLQNGLGNIEAILSRIPRESFLAGRLIFGVETTPGVAKVTVNADSVFIGALPGVQTRLSAHRMATTLSDAKIPTKAVPNILTYIWSKVIYNCALNAICTIHEMPYGKILENEYTRTQMRAVVRECYAVGAAEGIVLEPKTADEYIELLEKNLIPKTAQHYPSMLQDLMKGKRMDIASLNGAIIDLGQKKNVPTPVNQELVSVLLKKAPTSTPNSI